MDKLSQTQIQNYTLISKVGEGATAQVILAKQNLTKTLCVLKMIEKSNLVHPDDEKRLIQQRQALMEINHPFLIKFYQAFQTRKHLCLALQYCPGGDLYTHLHMSQRFNEEKISFYAAQLVLALQYLHQQNIIFRDLKPENILIGKDGYLKLIDFGMSKLDASSDDFRTYSICGTSQYTSPEVLEREGHGKSFDWWTLGCCLYELVYKISPFYSDDRTEMFEKILNDQPEYDEDVSSSLIDLIQGLLQKNPEKRMRFANQIKDHAFFSEIDFQRIFRKQYPASYVPEYARGKKILKVVRDEVQQFTDFQNCKTSETAYIGGFDYIFVQEQQLKNSRLSLKSSQRTQKTKRTSTYDDQECSGSQGSRSTLQEDEPKHKEMWQTF